MFNWRLRTRPESTIDYYKLIIEYYQRLKGKEEYPEILTNSLNVNRLLGMVARRNFDKLTEYLLSAIEERYKASANLAAIGANTLYIIFDRAKNLSSIPLISIVEETAKRAEDLKMERVGLLGNKFTMEEDFFKKELLRFGVKTAVPNY
ncbi:aspartate/glutamate racemase family protein [Orenia metallireducens]